MMNSTISKEINALVLKSVPYKESSLLLTVLTKESGKQNVLCRGVKRCKKEKLFAEKFAYSKMRLYVGRGIPVVDDAELTEPFYALRQDIEKLSLAEYFCEVVLCIPFGSGDDKILSLLLNSFWLLCGSEVSPLVVKTAFELKFAQHEGFAPMDFDCSCGKPAEKWSFSRGFLCDDCAKGDGVYVSQAIINAVRHILSYDGRRAYSFEMNEEALSYLSKITEKYLQYHLDTKFDTLEYYKKFMEADFG
ncbi:MAG: DNA repair protein RecO [Clostridiales bacterium]|nr:MAG: DNA repair protein RecO [Clostridiales bacterium]